MLVEKHNDTHTRTPSLLPSQLLIIPFSLPSPPYRAAAAEARREYEKEVAATAALSDNSSHS